MNSNSTLFYIYDTTQSRNPESFNFENIEKDAQWFDSILSEVHFEAPKVLTDKIIAYAKSLS